jgi:hypothetical protein
MLTEIYFLFPISERVGRLVASTLVTARLNTLTVMLLNWDFIVVPETRPLPHRKEKC